MLGTIAALLGEDDARLAKFTANYLEDHDVHVTHVGDGDAALRMFERNRYDISVRAFFSRSGRSCAKHERRGTGARAREANRGCTPWQDRHLEQPRLRNHGSCRVTEPLRNRPLAHLAALAAAFRRAACRARRMR